jgi:hypothetical protein
MSDLLTGLGIALVLEGLLWALAPHLAIRGLQAMAETPSARVKAIAWAIVSLGIGIVWLVRG